MKDKFGKALLELYTKGKTNIQCITYREDGVHETTDLKKYLQPYEKFVEIQKKALKHVKGHILEKDKTK